MCTSAERRASRPSCIVPHVPVQSLANPPRSRQNFTSFSQSAHRPPSRERISRCHSKLRGRRSGLACQPPGQREPPRHSPVPHSPLAQVLCEISDSSSVPFREPLDELKRICGISNVLPKACTLSDSLLGCVYEGTFNGSKVRVRRVRTHPKGDPQKVKEVCTPRHVFRLPGAHRPQTFHQVAVVWKYLKHPNIVPLLGVTLDPPQLISDRMPGGDLTEYIMSHPDTDRISLVSDLSTSLYETLTPSSAVWCRRGSQTLAFA